MHALVVKQLGVGQRTQGLLVHLGTVDGGVLRLDVEVLVRVVLHELEEFLEQHDLLRIFLGAAVELAQLRKVEAVDAPTSVGGARNICVVEDHEPAVAAQPHIAFNAMNGKFQRFFKRSPGQLRVHAGESAVRNDVCLAHSLQTYNGFTPRATCKTLP